MGISLSLSFSRKAAATWHGELLLVIWTIVCHIAQSAMCPEGRMHAPELIKALLPCPALCEFLAKPWSCTSSELMTKLKSKANINWVTEKANKVCPGWERPRTPENAAAEAAGVVWKLYRYSFTNKQLVLDEGRFSSSGELMKRLAQQYASKLGTASAGAASFAGEDEMMTWPPDKSSTAQFTKGFNQVLRDSEMKAEVDTMYEKITVETMFNVLAVLPVHLMEGYSHIERQCRVEYDDVLHKRPLVESSAPTGASSSSSGDDDLNDEQAMALKIAQVLHSKVNHELELMQPPSPEKFEGAERAARVQATQNVTIGKVFPILAGTPR